MRKEKINTDDPDPPKEIEYSRKDVWGEKRTYNGKANTGLSYQKLARTSKC